MTAFAVAGLAVGGSAFLEACTKSSTTPSGPTVDFTLDLTLPANAALGHTGGYIYSNGVIVAKTSTSYIALSQSCTHQGCTVTFNSGGNDFVCPCHGGIYSLDGSVMSGPPPSPLKSYSVTKNGNILSVKG